ncbi:MAG: bifunctional UDP-N-acetylglucosamine diphosphorylase/glucosamine-1-phosphate N-acetyltransferase GlmU [Gammaproteobacteria bacterium]
MSVTVVVLAAGQGKRMNSDLPKVLHPVAAKPMIEHVLDTAAAVSDATPVVIYGHGGETLQKRLAHRTVLWAEQREQLGTGHAVAQALPQVPRDRDVLILYGDVPLLTAAALAPLVAAAQSGGIAVLTAHLADPTGYGRIVRGGADDAVQRIVEHKDAGPAELDIREINTGIMVVSGDLLHRWIPALGNDNAQGEYYLTDCIAMAVAEGRSVGSATLADADEALGVNNRRQLAEVERLYQARMAGCLLDAGVTLVDPARIDIRGDVECGRDVLIDVNVVLQGRVRIGDNVRIGPNNVITDCDIGDGVEILPNCVLESATIGSQSRIGPFSRVRPETRLGVDVHIGNFVEIKKADIGKGSKVNHLAYVGDAEIGERVNVGAGTITCNYDGAFKHKTVLEDDVFVGSDTQLVAPVRVGRGVTIGAGTTVTEDVEAERLVISRVRQKTITGWQRPRKDKA